MPETLARDICWHKARFWGRVSRPALAYCRLDGREAAKVEI